MNSINNKIKHRFNTLNSWHLLPPMIILLSVFLFIFSKNGNYIEEYIGVQKELFFYLNDKLSSFPRVEYNLTQLGDVLIVFPLLMIFIRYAPKLWEALLVSSLLSLVVSAGLKKLFSVPRPARFFGEDSFTIIGRTLTGHNSCPSGHSITAFIIITLLLFAFMPRHKVYTVSFLKLR